MANTGSRIGEKGNQFLIDYYASDRKEKVYVYSTTDEDDVFA